MKVLVIENKNVHYSTVSSLQEHEVHIVNSIKPALNILMNPEKEENVFDVILIDMLMPDIIYNNDKALTGLLVLLMAMKNKVPYIAVAVPMRDERGIMELAYEYIVNSVFKNDTTKVLI